jgi:predicted esterase
MKFFLALAAGSIVGLLITRGPDLAGEAEASVDAGTAGEASPERATRSLDDDSEALAQALLAYVDGPDEPRAAPAAERAANAEELDAIELSARLVGSAAHLAGLGAQRRAPDGDGLGEPPVAQGTARIASMTPPALPRTDLPPLTADDPYWHVPLDGFGDAVVWLPLGTTTQRPLIIATHGNYDRPEWVCERWSYIVPDAFIVCPRGMPRSTDSGHTQRYHHRSRRYLDEELDALLPMVEARFGERIAPGPVLYTGFSQGAIFGQRFVVREPARFAYAVLASGGDEWSQSDAEAFAAGGGRAVLFVCGQAECARNSERAAQRLRELGVRADLVHHSGAGHTYDMDMVRDTVARLPWLFEGDERWSTGERSRHWVRADLVDR